MNDIVTRLREIDGFGWQCGKPLKDKGTYLRCGCGCSQPADGMDDGMTVSRPAILGEAADEIERLRAERDALFVLTDRLTAEHDALRAERDEVRQSYCSLMEAYRGGNGRITANKLGWGYLFEDKENKENTND